MTQFTRLLALFAFALFLPVAFAQTPVPIPITGNLGSITGAPTPDAYVQLQLQNCSGGLPQITGFQGIVQSSYRFPADVNGNVNGTVWSNDQITCSGTTGATQYAMTIVVDDSPVGQTQCYQVVHTQGNWNINTQPAITCTATPPNPQDGYFNNIFATLNVSANTGTFAGGVSAASFTTTGAFNAGSAVLSGALTAQTIGATLQVKQLAGASIDAQINQCFTQLGTTGGRCDATGYGATVQKFQSAITNPSGVPIQLIFDPATKLQPSTATMNMFHLNRGIQVYNPHVDIVGSGFQLTYSGTVFLIDDNIRDGDDFVLYDANVDNVNYSNRAQPAAGSIGLKFNATDISTSSQVGAKIDGFQCKYLDECLVINASGGGFANSNLFSNIYLDGCKECLVLNGSLSPTSSVEGNLFTNLFIQAEGWTTAPIIGTNNAAKNLITDCAIWDNPSANDVSWDGTSVQNYTACFFTKAIAGSSQNSYWNVGSEVGVPGLLSQSYVRSPYLQGTGTASTYATQGNYSVWNASAGNGESDFVNAKGSGTGGFNWYNVADGATSVGSPLLQLDASGNLTPAGYVNAASYKVGSVALASTNLSDTAILPRYCGASTFSAGTSGTAVACSWVTAGSHCAGSWVGTPGAGILGFTAGAATVTPTASAASSGTASVYCSVN